MQTRFFHESILTSNLKSRRRDTLSKGEAEFVKHKNSS